MKETVLCYVNDLEQGMGLLGDSNKNNISSPEARYK
jgi:hypothetical protein